MNVVKFWQFINSSSEVGTGPQWWRTIKKHGLVNSTRWTWSAWKSYDYGKKWPPVDDDL